MALNTKGKKTSLTEEASIYQKRQDDLSDKERIKNMTGKQKRDFFKTYYLPKLLVILAVAGVVFYIVWVDFINKSHIYMRCAILNESITDSILTEFSDRFTDSMKMDYKKNRASFYMYYTRSDVAREMGADTGSDLSEISSRLVANSLDCMIASYEDVENILKDNQKGPKHGSGVGLINVHTRIQLMFGNKYGLIVESEPDEGTTVTIHLPAVPYTKENCEVLETPGKPVRKEGES